LILPSDFKGNVPAGYFPVRQQTYGGFWLLRTIPKSDSQADQDAAIALLKKIRMGTDDIRSFPNERPAHHVKVEGFWMDDHDITQC